MANALPSTFDSTFTRYAGRIPVAFLRALGFRESGLNPKSVMPGSSAAARGLMQITGVARTAYNERHHTNYSADSLLDPEVSVRIAADLLERIIDAYKTWADRAPNMREDWSNPEFVKLLVAGWNAGYSQGGGVQKVASYLLGRGLPVTHDSVFANAAPAGAVQYLQLPARQKWQRSVADLFYAQPDWRSSAGGSFSTLALIGFIGWGLYSYTKRHT